MNLSDSELLHMSRKRYTDRNISSSSQFLNALRYYSLSYRVYKKYMSLIDNSVSNTTAHEAEVAEPKVSSENSEAFERIRKNTLV